MGHAYMYEVVQDADREYPLVKGTRFGHLDVVAMLSMETIAEGSVLRKRSGGMQIVRRINGRLKLQPMGKARHG